MKKYLVVLGIAFVVALCLSLIIESKEIDFDKEIRTVGINFRQMVSRIEQMEKNLEVLNAARDNLAGQLVILRKLRGISEEPIFEEVKEAPIGEVPVTSSLGEKEEPEADKKEEKKDLTKE